MQNDRIINRLYKPVHWMCAGIFCVFTFCYIFFYQSDILALGQHVLSEGVTHFNRSVGAVLITLALYLIHIPIHQLTRLNKRAYALNYFPSLLILAVITDVSPTIDEGFSFGAWLWVAPLLLVLFVVSAWILYQLQPYEEDFVGIPFLSRPAWINVATLLLMFLLTGWVSNHNDVFHYRMRMETKLLDEQTEEALKVGAKAEQTNAQLDFLRAFALAKREELGDRLFDYPLSGDAKAMKLDGKKIKTLQIPDSVMEQSMTSHVKADMKLSGYLIDRRLDLFAKAVTTIYNDSTMPRFYREAMALYRLQNHVVPVTTQDSVAYYRLTLYRQFMDSISAPPLRLENIARHAIPHTYLYYYQFAPLLKGKRWQP